MKGQEKTKAQLINERKLEYSREELLSMPITATHPNNMPKAMTRSCFFGYSLNGRGELS